jgi:thiosulfate/3-mercaptopyruvate sulfurtransferase
MSGNPLVGADRLAAELAAATPPVLLDCRWQLAGGADQAAYDQGDAGGAARAWWLLGFFGHPDPRVLDGGLPAWVAAGRPLDTRPPDQRPGGFTARPGRRPLLDAAGAARTAAGGVLLDARVPARYAGREEPVDPVAGHVPGARNAPMGDLLGGGRLLPGGELRRRFEALGVREGVAVGAYCGSGVVAAQLVLALEAAGLPGCSLYPGSWSEWVADPGRPVAVGDDPGGPVAIP